MTFRVKWIPAVLLFPVLYLLGWLIVQPLRLLAVDLIDENISLIGSIFSFFFFLALLDNWKLVRWNKLTFYKDIYGSKKHRKSSIFIFFRGFMNSFLLIILILIFLAFLGKIEWKFDFLLGQLFNAIFLCFLVGFAEEVIFREWLWGELTLLVNYKSAKIFQAIIFSLVHFRWGMGFSSSIMLLIGLFLLGLVLGQRRILDGGSLFGCIGFHGGLVSLWFLVENSFVDFSTNIPAWLIGPGGLNPNPIGGVLAIISLSFVLLIQLDKETILRRSFLGTCNASSKEEMP